MMKYRSACVIVIFITMPLLSGCMIVDGLAGNIHSPHESFLNHYGWYVGKSIQFFRSTASPPVSVKKLPNGNYEEEYWLWKGTCRFYYECDSQTGIIVRWRYEGGEQSCVQNPYN